MFPIRRKSMVVKLFEKQGGKCHYCGGKMRLAYGYQNSVTRDHIIPRSAGGPTTAFNLVGACYRCNQEKGSLPYEVFVSNLALKKTA